MCRYAGIVLSDLVETDSCIHSLFLLYMSRRKLWDLIQQLSEKRSVILTTHSMEEAGTFNAQKLSGKSLCEF